MASGRDPDADAEPLRVVHPSPGLRIFWAVSGGIGLTGMAASFAAMLDANWMTAVAAGFGFLGSGFLARRALPLALARWETIIDARAGTVTRRVRRLRTLREDRHRVDAFRAVVVRRLFGRAADPGSPLDLFHVVLIGPGVRLDLDDPGEEPLGGLARLLGRIPAYLDPAGRLALAEAVARRTGLRCKDFTRPPGGLAPGRVVVLPGPRATPPAAPTLVIRTVPRFVRFLAAVLLLDGLAIVALFPWFGHQANRPWTLEGVSRGVALSSLPIAAAVALSYRSSLVFDFAGRQFRRRGGFLLARWDRSYPFDEFEGVVVREAKVPFRREPYRTVELSEGRFRFSLYDARRMPKALDRAAREALGDEAAGASRDRRLIASAEALAALCGLPLRVVREAEAPDDPEPVAPGPGP